MPPTPVQVDPMSMTTHHIFMGAENDNLISTATGFIYQRDKEFFLITNWHNASGKNPLTNAFHSSTGAIPTSITTAFRLKDRPAALGWETLPLYSDPELLEPLWLVHPIHGKKVDVVAIRLPKVISEKYELCPVNCIDFDNDFQIEVADEAFVIGYPFSTQTQAHLPIWKKASIASEPGVDVEQLPKMLIDTATRSGLSGSPVIAQRIGVHGMVGGKISPSTSIGRVRKFVGVYSGRIGDDELKAQLGIVWKAKVIEEIISAQTLDRIHQCPSLGFGSQDDNDSHQLKDIPQ